MKEVYNYYKAVYSDIEQYIKEHDIKVTSDNKEDIYEELYDELFLSDSVTGNASGSYTFNTWKAEENLCHNSTLLIEALEEFSLPMSTDAESLDVTIRCYLLGSILTEVLDDLSSEE